MTDEKPFQRSTAQAHGKAAGTIGSATAAGADHDQVKQHGELLVAALHRAEADDLAEVLARAFACGGYTGRGCVARSRATSAVSASAKCRSSSTAGIRSCRMAILPMRLVSVVRLRELGAAYECVK